MAQILYVTAAALKTVLCYIDPEKTPKVAFDRDDMAVPLANKIKEALGDRDGSQSVSISFSDSQEDKELKRQFRGVCEKISEIFNEVYLISA
jgi:hypothetical protein